MEGLIPSTVSDIDSDQDIPQSAAELAENTESPESKPYTISFSEYNSKLCEIQNLPKNAGKNMIKMLRDIGTSIYSSTDFQKENIKFKPIDKRGDYKKLYRGLSSDIILKELFPHGETRIFYFDVEAKRRLYIVAITANHYETKKQRK